MVSDISVVSESGYLRLDAGIDQIQDPAGHQPPPGQDKTQVWTSLSHRLDNYGGPDCVFRKLISRVTFNWFVITPIFNYCLRPLFIWRHSLYPARDLR